MACLIKCLRKALPLMVLLLLGLLETTSSKRLQVHMIVNSHMDLGWVNTIDEYFTGARTRYGETANGVYNNVFNELYQDKSRTYSIGEVGFLQIWWQYQTQETKDKVIKLFEEGQLELINGGLVGNDEATAMYDDIIQNFISGQRWAKENLKNTNSTVGWQMDSFGTSVTQAYLLKEAGYDATFFSRVDNDERQRRKESQSLEFNWNFPNGAGSMFTHMMSQTYYKPILSRARWIAELFYGNLDEQDFQELIRNLKADRSYFNTDHILVLFCGDFWMSYDARTIYDALDDIVHYFKRHAQHEIDVFYSNPGRFIREVKKDLAERSVNVADKHGDFFPLNEEPGTVWSGFYSSKSSFKAYVRWHSRYLNAANLIVSQRAMSQFETSNTSEYADLNSALTEMEKAIGIVQHHDAVSGTMKEHVRFDYEDILTRARKNLEDKLQGILLENIKAGQSEEAVVLPLNSTYDNLLEGATSPQISKTTLHADSDLLLAVMNPGNKRLFLITANTTSTPTTETCITVESSDGKIILPDIVCQGSESKKCSIYFTDTLEAYAWMYYQIKVKTKTGGQERCGALLNSQAASSGRQIEGSHWTLQIDDGNVFTFMKGQVKKQFKLSYSYFESATEDRGKHHASGAYIFMPRTTEKKPLSTENHTVVWTGNHLAIVQIQSANFTTTLQIILKQEQTGFSVITQLAPINKAPKGCEIVMEITVPDLQTDGKFFTDTNGYFMLERPYTSASPQETPEDEITKNYHPITTRCSLEGNNEAFTIFTDRAQGASIQKDKQINIMIHRVAVEDDGEGLDELLYEKDRNTSIPLAITTWHYFLWSDISSQNPEREETQYDTERPLRIWLFSVNNAFSVDSISQKDHLPLDLPRSLKVNVRAYDQNTHSIRLQNLDPKNTLSVMLSGISHKSPSLISYLSQNSLTGVATIKETYWTTTQDRPDSSEFDLTRTVKIELAPLQMRTFELSVGKLDESQVIPEEESGTTIPTPDPTNTTPNTTDNTNNTNSSSDNTTSTPPVSNPNATPDNTTNATNNTTDNSPHNTTNATSNNSTNATGSTTHTTPETSPNPVNPTAQNNTTDNTTNNIPDSSNPKVDNEGPSRIPEIEVAVSADQSHGIPLLGLGYYMIFHICVGTVYFVRCYLKARKRNIPLGTFKRDILIVAALGPIGFAVLWYLNKNEVTAEDKREILP